MTPFPHLCALLLAVALPSQVRIVAFGDSTTASQSAVQRTYIDRLTIKSQKFNAGEAHDTTVHALVRLPTVLNYGPDICIVEFGLSASVVEKGQTAPRVPLTRFVANLRRIVNGLREHDCDVVLMTSAALRWGQGMRIGFDHPPYDTGDPWGFDVVNREYAQAVRDVARRMNAPLVDVHSAFRDHEHVDELMSAGMHPTDLGHELIAQLLTPVIEKLCEDRPSREPRNAEYVTDGVAKTAVFDDSERGWKPVDNALEGTGARNPLLASDALGTGDFKVEARLRMLDQARSRARFQLGDSAFGFDSRRGALFGTGPLFGNSAVSKPSREFFERDTWIDFVVQRRGDNLTFHINDQEIVSIWSRRLFPEFGFAAGSSRMQVEDFRASGDLRERKIVLNTRGYSIPTLDLADQTERQVVVDREPGKYLGHPTTVLLEDGKTMIAVYPKGHGRGAIVMKRSTDGGRTWSDRLPTPSSWTTSKETPTIYRIVDPAGTKRLIVFSGLYPIRRSLSDDDGATWTELEPIGEFGGIVAMSSLVRLRDGRYLALFHDDGRFIRRKGKRKNPPRFIVYKTLSADGGLTWSDPLPIAEHTTARLCEPGAIRSPDGGTIAVLLRENRRRANSFVIFSDNEGETWSLPRELPGALTGDRHVARYGPDGRLFISFRDRTAVSPTHGDWVAWVGTWDDIVNGTEGQYRVRLMDNHKDSDCAYPGVEVLPDGTFVATTYGHWTEGEEPYIVSVRLKLDELDELARD